MTSASSRPRVICHMMSSLDGRIVTEGWPLSKEERRQYEQVHATYQPDAWMCGRVTMESFASGTRSDEEVAREHQGPPRDDFVAVEEDPSVRSGRALAIAVDPRGRLLWESGEMDGDHVVTLLTERVSDDYLAELRGRGVSYFLAGTDEVDVERRAGDVLWLRYRVVRS